MLATIARWLGRATPAAAPEVSPATVATPEPPVRREPHLVRVIAATPPRRRRRREPADLPASLQARRLLHWCQTEGGATGDILASELIEIHQHQCAYDLIEPLHWQAVATELKRLIGGGKTYRWVERPDGRHRLRFYRIPPLPRGSDSTFLELADWLARETAPEPVRLRRAA